MAYNTYFNGAGGTTGDSVATSKPLILGTTGHVWYVSSTTPGAADAVSPRGRERETPLLTLSQAYTNAASGDAIVFLENHAETISSNLTVGKALTIVSEGSGSSRAKLTCNVGGNPMLTLATAGASIRNIYFPASKSTPTGRISVTATTGVTCDGCYFECGSLDLSATYLINATSACRIANTTFIATAAQPAIGLSVPGAMAALVLENVTFDGAGFGFSSAAFTALGVLTGLYANNINLLNNADVSLAATWTGVWVPGVTSGSARFEA